MRKVDAEARATKRCAAILDRWLLEWRQILKTLRLPHRLPARPKTGETFSHREAMAEAMGALGFRGGGRTLKMHKKLASGTRIVVRGDIGTWSHAASFNLDIDVEGAPLRWNGVDWTGARTFPIFFTPTQDLDHGSHATYKVASAEAWRKMMANAAVVVTYLEREYGAELERIVAAMRE